MQGRSMLEAILEALPDRIVANDEKEVKLAITKKD